MAKKKKQKTWKKNGSPSCEFFANINKTHKKEESIFLLDRHQFAVTLGFKMFKLNL